METHVFLKVTNGFPQLLPKINPCNLRLALLGYGNSWIFNLRLALVLKPVSCVHAPKLICHLSPDLIDLGLPTLRRTARRNKHRQCWSLESTFAQPVAQPKHPLGHAWTVLAASRDSLLCFHATLRTYQCRKCKKGATTFKQSPPKVCVDAGPSCCWMLWFRPLTSLKGTVGTFLGPRTAILRSRTCLPSSPAAALALLPCPRLLCARLSLAGLTCLWQMEPRHIAGGSRMPT